MTCDELIRIEGLRVNLGGRRVLDVDRLCVAAGEVLAVLGPNGAGKSTLLRVCAGYQRPSAGQVSVLGERLDRLGGFGITRLRCRIGYVPQMLAVAGELPVTVREVVAIGRGGIRGLLRPLDRQDWSIVDDWIERMGLSRVAHQAYAQTSGGEQRKALLARAMVQRPELLLLDEPSAHLDVGAREQMVQTIDRLHHILNLGIVLVCHEVEVLPPACRRVLILNRGSIEAVGTPEEALTAPRVRSLYGPGLCVLHRSGRHAVLPEAEGWK